MHPLRSRVAIVNNGNRKGGSAEAFRVLETAPGLEDIWQLHWSIPGGVEHNAPGAFIANIEDNAALATILTAQPPEPGAATRRRTRRGRRPWRWRSSAHAGVLDQGLSESGWVVHRHEHAERLQQNVSSEELTGRRGCLIQHDLDSAIERPALIRVVVGHGLFRSPTLRRDPRGVRAVFLREDALDRRGASIAERLVGLRRRRLESV